MKAETVLKSINTAIKRVESARYFSQHDMPESAQEAMSEALGHLECTKLYLEIETNQVFKSDVQKDETKVQ